MHFANVEKINCRVMSEICKCILIFKTSLSFRKVSLKFGNRWCILIRMRVSFQNWKLF